MSAELCCVCGRLPHAIDDPECMPETRPVSEKLAWALAEIQRLRAALARQAPAPLPQAAPEGKSSQELYLGLCLDDDDTLHATIMRKESSGAATVLLSDYVKMPRGQDIIMRGSDVQPQAVTEDARDGERSGLLKLARYGAAMLHWHRGDNPGESGDIDAITCEEEAIRCGVLEGRNVDEPCCESCVCAPFVGWEVCYFCPDDVKAAKAMLAARAATSGSKRE